MQNKLVRRTRKTSTSHCLTHFVTMLIRQGFRGFLPSSFVDNPYFQGIATRGDFCNKRGAPVRLYPGEIFREDAAIENPSFNLGIKESA